jgi:Glycosyl transferase family 2
MRKHACDMPVIFKMDHPSHGVLWRDETLEFGNVGTPMMLVPNVPDKLGVWEAHAPALAEPGGDFTFLSGCVANMGGPVWRPEVVVRIRPQDRMSVCVVTPWWNHHELIPDYEVAIDVGEPDELIVVDNASDPPIALPGVRADSNLGFSAACNLGLEAATADAVLFLNNDVEATSSGWLDQIRKALEPGVLVGASIRHDRHADVDGQRFPWIDGWCLAGMRDDLLELGGWDASFDEPSYFGDNDLCLRARARGMVLRQARVGLRHKLNQTARRDDPVTVAASLANRARYELLARDLIGEPVGV